VTGLFLTFFLFSVFDVFTGRSTAQASFPAPSRLAASDASYNTKIGLNWDHVRGVTLYRIFRNVTNDPNTAAQIGTSTINYFFDSSGPAGQSLFYWVRGENGAVVGPLSDSDQGSRTGTAQQGPVPPLDPP